MSVRNCTSKAAVLPCATLLAALVLLTAGALAAEPPGTPEGGGQRGRTAPGAAPACEPGVLGSPFISVDSWVYPAVLRLYSLGFVDNVFVGMRPWTRASVGHMVEEAGMRIDDADPGPATDEAQDIYEALMHELRFDMEGPCMAHQGGSRVESVYSVARGISGTPLRDSYHLGSTIVNDYGRPFESGFNNYSGASGYASAGRFVVYVRGEFQAASSATGYSSALSQLLSSGDGKGYMGDEITFLNPLTTRPYNQATIPMGPIAATTDARVMEAFVSAHYLNHEISFGKQDDWLGPGLGGGMAYSNNAENIYSLRINRIEPLRIPLVSRVLGPIRYDFIVGSLRGHTYVPIQGKHVAGQPDVVNPGDPWVHAEKISIRPTENLELGFERTIIWGGKGHEPITLHSFLKGFFSLSATTAAIKYSRNDPGARFGAFDFSYRLPFLRKWLTLYSDGEVHDDLSPADAPRRAAWRPGIYLSHFPGVPKLDLRVEASDTDPAKRTSNGGLFMYYEAVQKQGYTNKGNLFGDWIGREDKGGQAWLTYHLSGNEWIQVSARNQKAAKDFIPGGTTINDINFQVVKRVGRDFEINGNFALEHWKAPIYLPGPQTVTTTTVQLTWFPGRKISF
jgi:hypothetical protein